MKKRVSLRKKINLMGLGGRRRTVLLKMKKKERARIVKIEERVLNREEAEEERSEAAGEEG